MNAPAYTDKPEPAPPVCMSRDAGHHWLEERDFDGHSFGYVIMQWQPTAKRWCHSGYVASGRDIDTRNWLYVAPVVALTDQQIVDARKEVK